MDNKELVELANDAGLTIGHLARILDTYPHMVMSYVYGTPMSPKHERALRQLRNFVDAVQATGVRDPQTIYDLVFTQGSNGSPSIASAIRSSIPRDQRLQYNAFTVLEQFGGCLDDEDD